MRDRRAGRIADGCACDGAEGVVAAHALKLGREGLGLLGCRTGKVGRLIGHIGRRLLGAVERVSSGFGDIVRHSILERIEVVAQVVEIGIDVAGRSASGRSRSAGLVVAAIPSALIGMDIHRVLL